MPIYQLENWFTKPTKVLNGPWAKKSRFKSCPLPCSTTTSKLRAFGHPTRSAAVNAATSTHRPVPQMSWSSEPTIFTTGPVYYCAGNVVTAVCSNMLTVPTSFIKPSNSIIRDEDAVVSAG